MFNFFRRSRIKAERNARIEAKRAAMEKEREKSQCLLSTMRTHTAQINTLLATQRFKAKMWKLEE